MSDRSWWSRTQGAADWATGNRWDFDNMGGMSSGTVTGSPSSFSGAVSPEWTKPSGGNWFHPDNAGLRAGAISDAFSPRSNAVAAASAWNDSRNKSSDKVINTTAPSMVQNLPGANTSLIQPFGPASNWGKYEMYHHPQKQGGGLMGTIGRIGGFIAGNMIAPGVGGGPGAAIGGSIGDSIG